MRKIMLWMSLFAVAILIPYLDQFTARNSQKALQASLLNDSNPLIIIDAGHGGTDGGTVAIDGTPEKEINLSIAKKLNVIFTTNGFRTKMTRTEDCSIHDESAKTIRQKKISDIHNRLNMMASEENSIFVSIHQNHFTQEKYSGTQVFYSRHFPESRTLAECIQNSVVQELQHDNKRSIKQTGTEIYLLYHALCPAVMVECGFLSNANETALLKQNDYQNQMALSIYKGIYNYLSQSEEM